MAVDKRRLRLLLVLDMLENETDAEHGLAMDDILQRLAEASVELGLSEGDPCSFGKKAVYGDLAALREFGLAIEKVQRGRDVVEYRLAERDFELSELQLIADAVQSSRFLSDKKADELVRGLKRLAPSFQRNLLDRRVAVAGRVERQGESQIEALDRIHEALAGACKLRFDYFKYDTSGHRVPRNDGKPYVQTPVSLLYNDDFYYLRTFDEQADDFKTFRVDRMGRLEVLYGEPAQRNERIATYQAKGIASRAFGMRDDEQVSVTFWVHADAMNGVIDRFGIGKDVRVKRIDEHAAHVTVKVSKSWSLFGWIVQFGDQVRIEKPASLAKEYRELLEKIIRAHGPSGAGLPQDS